MRLDVLLRGGTVADGTGGPLRTADVGGRGNRLVVLEPGDVRDAAEVMDVTGAVVAPGFIDVHTHSDAVTLLRPVEPG